MLIALVLAGGSGKRFWPLSRRSKPKQFLEIGSDKSMIRVTINRLLKRIAIEDIYVVTTVDQRDLLLKDIPEFLESNIILEPEGMNTAPAIGLSAKFLDRKYSADDCMLVVSSDHIINDEDKFIQSVDFALNAAGEGYLVTFGIKPNYPATGYGYIEAGRDLGYGMEVVSFKEKPSIDVAEEFLKRGNYYWNSGMFLWKLEVILKSFKCYLPEMDGLLSEISRRWDVYGMECNITDIYRKMPKIPVDIGIMERAKKRVVIPVDYGWSDVGSWKALAELAKKDKNGNFFVGGYEVIDSRDCYIHVTKLVALIGVENLIVVDTEDALLIIDRDRSEDVKKIVNNLEKKGKDKYL